MKNLQNRQVKQPGPRELDVEQHCKKHGVDAAEAKKLVKLLGRHAPLHELAC